VLLDHADGGLTDADRCRDLLPDAEHRLRRFPHRQLVAIPLGHGGMRLERRVQRHGCPVRAPNDHVRFDQPAIHITALDHGG
jgi:hypothetical protein